MLDYKFGDRLPVHEHGYVSLLETMGSDETIVDSARISYDRRGKTEDRALIRFLLRHRHTSPFEMGVLRFEIKMPIFVARQWIRHRTASLNEMSARYTELPNEMFVPEVFAVQSTGNKQGRGGIDYALDDFGPKIDQLHRQAYCLYEDMLDAGMARELARGVLPVNIYTKFVWKMDLHNLMHFLDLRLDPHAQEEIRDFAEVIEKLVALKFPITHEAFVDYIRDAYTCSRMEIEILREVVWMYADLCDEEFSMNATAKKLGMSKREIDAFNERFLSDQRDSE